MAGSHPASFVGEEMDWNDKWQEWFLKLTSSSILPRTAPFFSGDVITSEVSTWGFRTFTINIKKNQNETYCQQA